MERPKDSPTEFFEILPNKDGEINLNMILELDTTDERGAIVTFLDGSKGIIRVESTINVGYVKKVTASEGAEVSIGQTTLYSKPSITKG